MEGVNIWRGNIWRGYIWRGVKHMEGGYTYIHISCGLLVT